MKRMPLPDDLIDELRAKHDGEDRGYHDWSHPLDMITTMQPIRLLLQDALAVVCATVTHDVINDPHRTDNEELSAQFAERRLAGIVSDDTLARAARMIRATSAHVPQDGLSADDLHDTMHFLDLDLSILGADVKKFDAYEAGVRHEYRHVEWHRFATRRAEILKRFLKRDRIYQTEWGRLEFEAPARRNLARSIARLRQATQEERISS